MDAPPDPVPPVTPAPGWYPDPEGAVRWWDGAGWGPVAPPQGYGTPYGAMGYGPPGGPPRADKGMAALSHAGTFTGAGFILPLIFFLVKKDEPYTRHHAAEALNFQIAAMVAMIAAYAFLFIPLLSLGPRQSAPAWIAIPGVLFFVVLLGYWVFSVIGIVKAAQGKWYRYPVTIRFVKGPYRKGEEPPPVP